MNDRSPRYPSSSVPAGPSSPAASGGSAHKSHAPTVVVVDDETHIRLVVGEKFRSEGFTVFEARDGEEALELVNAHLPDAIVTDLQMPYMNGVELCTRIAEQPRTAHIPALLLTARGHIVDSAQLEKTVIRKVMAKPFSSKSLFENVQALLSAAAESKGLSAVPAPAAFKRPANAPAPPLPLTGEAA